MADDDDDATRRIVASISTEFCPDAVEFCPARGREHVVVCANYQLVDGETQTKRGRLLCFDASDPCVAEPSFAVDTGAVFDIKWSQGGEPLLGEVNADGHIVLYRLAEGVALERLTMARPTDDPVTAALSLDWSGAGEPELAVSYASGALATWAVREGAELALQRQWQGHEFEAWIAARDPHRAHVVYSGGDDAALKVWDTRAESGRPVAKITEHTAGVCSIRHSSAHPEHFVSGSYDERVCLWDVRALRKPLASLDAGGGVWRLKWHPSDASQLLAACMFGGYVVLRVDLDAGAMVVTSRRRCRERLCYGADWAPSALSCSLVGTCSFYDKKFELWHV